MSVVYALTPTPCCTPGGGGGEKGGQGQCVTGRRKDQMYMCGHAQNTQTIHILVINVTASCIRGCTASFGLLVTGKEKEKKRGRAKRTTDSKSTQLMGIQGTIKEMCVGGGR